MRALRRAHSALAHRRRRTRPRIHLILEIKGFDPLEEVKTAAAKRWAAAVNAETTYGTWSYAIAKRVADVAGIVAEAAGPGE